VSNVKLKTFRVGPDQCWSYSNDSAYTVIASIKGNLWKKKNLPTGVGIGVWSMMIYNENGTKDVEPDFAQFVCLHSWSGDTVLTILMM
jgi:hypothetical protein